MSAFPHHSTSGRIVSAGDAAPPWRRQPNVMLFVMILLGALNTMLGAPTSAALDATPTGTLHHAGLVVEHGDGALTYVLVSFPEPELTGIELLERSELDFASVPFGGLGAAICQIESEGCDLAICRRTLCQTGSDAPFWQFLALTADGSWDAADLGASSFTVHDGDIVAWSWSNGPVDIPPITIEEIAAEVGVSPQQLSARDGTPGAVVRSAGEQAAGEADQAWTELTVGIAALLVIGAVGFVLTRRRTRVGETS